jgi:hypothetical protein|tara:strand:+ start:782 stop:961 length:180 start_codon:yes stop_codon:yes gene_type:complete
MFKKRQVVKWWCESSYEWLHGTVVEVSSVEIEDKVHVLYRVKIGEDGMRWASEEQLRLL